MNEAKAVIAVTGGTVQVEGTDAFVRDSIEQLKPSGTADASDAVLEHGLTHAWDWFSLHATQRLQGVYFFLLAAAFLTTAYVNALRYSLAGVAAGIAALGAVFSLCFCMLEARIKELIKMCEVPLKAAQHALAQKTSIESFEISEAVEKPKLSWTSYSKVFRTLYVCSIIASLGGLAFALYMRSQEGRGLLNNEFLLIFLYRVAVIISGLWCLCFSARLYRGERDSKSGSRYVLIFGVLLCGIVILVASAIKVLR